MKVVILAGGYGTRISEETRNKPKPMVEIGGRPILWHVMKLYSHYGYNDFIICLGYKGHAIKEYFQSYFLQESDLLLDYTEANKQRIFETRAEPWKITLIDTGEGVMTGGRLKRVQPYVGNETFMLTYSDGLSDINLNKLVQYHRAHGKLATVTAAQPDGRFGSLSVKEDGTVERFKEKPRGDGAWINGGFFVMEPQVFDYIEGDRTVLEAEPLQYLSVSGQLNAYRHEGYWKCMDTLHDRNVLEAQWSGGQAPWKKWQP